MNEKSGALRGLLIGGILLAVVGAITWPVASNQADHDERINGYSSALIGADGNGYVSPARVWMWVGIAVLILGVLLVVVYWVILAVMSSRDVPEAPERLDLGQRLAQRADEERAAQSRDVSELKSLADLHDRGVLSDDEFEAAKRRVLGAKS